MKKSWEQIHQELSEPFSHEDVEWKIQTVSKDKSRGLAVAYVTARAIQNRLDAVVGAQNWKPVFRQWHTVTDRDGNPIPSQLCTIQIFDDERHEWLEKTDGAENTDYEPVKGGLSDAMKRAASQWGIGRYLYKLGTPWVDVEFFGKTAVIAKKEMPGLNQFHDDFIAKLKGPMPGNRSNPPQQERQRSETSPQSNTSSGNRATTNGSAKPKISIADTPRYTIRKAVPHRFKSGIMTIMDIECENGDVFTVFCDKPDDALRAGTVLTNLRVSQRPGKDDPNRRFNTLESYRVASAAYCTAKGYIQGLQRRAEIGGKRCYVWVSSNPDKCRKDGSPLYPCGTRAHGWIHITGNVHSTTASITEGALKGDTASCLSNGALYLCAPGVNAIKYLPSAIRSLSVERLLGEYDMDQIRQEQYSAALRRMQDTLKPLGIPYIQQMWNPAYNGIDDYKLHSRWLPLAA